MSESTSQRSTFTPGTTGSEPTRYILPYTPPVGNQPVAEQQTVTGSKTRQAQQSVQITDYTWIEQTTGVGVGAFTVLFDVAFTSEPVVAHGMTLPDFAAEIRADVDKASADAAAAQAKSDAYAWFFDDNIRIDAFQTFETSDLTAPENRRFKFYANGIANSMNKGRKMQLIATGATGQTYPAQFINAADQPSDARRYRDTKNEGYSIITIAEDPDKVTWQLLADGTPIAATNGFDTTTTHAFTRLTQEQITARQAATTAGTAVGNVLALGGDASAFPLCNVYVKRWLLDNQNNYIGADCIVVVKTFGGTAISEPTPPISEVPQAS